MPIEYSPRFEHSPRSQAYLDSVTKLHQGAPTETPEEVVVHAVNAVEMTKQALVNIYYDAVQQLVDQHGVWVATGRMDNMWQARRPQWRKGRRWECQTDVDYSLLILDDLARLDSICGEYVEPSNGLIFKPGVPRRMYLR